MAVETTGAAARGGLRTALDMVVAPNAAFDALRTFPTWGWALVLSLAGAMLGSFLALPAYHHFIDASMPALLLKNSRIAGLAPDQQQAQIKQIITTQHAIGNFNFLLAPIGAAIGYALQALVILVARAASRGDGGFRRCWALACNAGVVGNGLGSLALGLICVLRGPDSFNTAADLQTALPSLALLAPGAPPALGALLGSANVFYVWAAALLALGMIRVVRISPPIAWGAATLFVLVPGCFAAFGVARGS